ncbi:hypothetical protein [Aeromonas veronii]|uniref:hypothetical protein n=1 Tax=Aeromonas veronii TaxID=654 RepID=UPI001116D04E|nr:hypothetical protein [Aeromonas veronii]TNJ16253.1 hypothetical protein CF113_09935 [Aeromonas veronii]
MKTAEEEVEILLSRWSGLLVHSDFVYGGFDSLQSRAIRELPALRKRLDAFANQFKDEPWKIEFLTCQDFAHPCNEIADQIISIIGNKDRLALLTIGICTEKYPFLVPLKDAQAMGKVKWPKASSKAVSFTHKNVELDLVGVVLFLTKVWGYKQNAVFQFIAIHGGLPDTDSGPTDGGQLSRAADKIRQQYRALKKDGLKLDYPEGSLQSEVWEKIKEK